MKGFASCLLLVLVLLTPPLQGSAGTLRMVSSNWPPYGAEYLHQFGFACEIIAQALAAAGHKVEFQFMPWKRAIVAAEAGEADAVFNAYYSEARAKSFFFTDSYIAGPIVLCSRKGSGLTHRSLHDLRGLRIGVVRGYANTPAFDEADYLSKEEGDNEVMNLKKLLLGRLDLIVIDKYVAMYLLENVPSVAAGKQSLEFLSPPGGEQSFYHVLENKSRPQTICRRLQQGAGRHQEKRRLSLHPGKMRSGAGGPSGTLNVGSQPSGTIRPGRAPSRRMLDLAANPPAGAGYPGTGPVTKTV